MGVKIYMNKEKFNSYNLLKIIAALSIACGLHYHYYFIESLEIEDLFTNGVVQRFFFLQTYVFVEMFFEISGIMYVFSYRKRIGDGQLRLDRFIYNRVIRLYPLIIVTSIFMYLANIVVYKFTGSMWRTGSIELWQLVADLIFAGKSLLAIDNTINSTIWYISVLMVCYVIAFFLTRLSYRLKSNLVMGLPIVIGIIAKNMELRALFINDDLARGYIAFFIGILIGLFLELFEKIKIAGNIRRAIGIGGIMCTFLLVSLLKFDVDRLIIGNKFFFFTIIVFPILLIALYNCDLINKLCSAKVIEFAGKISFGVYLWNLPILVSCFMLIKQNIITVEAAQKPIFIFILLVVHILVATLSYLFIEKPLISWLKGIVIPEITW